MSWDNDTKLSKNFYLREFMDLKKKEIENVNLAKLCAHNFA